MPLYTCTLFKYYYLLIQIYALLVIYAIKYHNQLRYQAPKINLWTGTIEVCTSTDTSAGINFITLNIILVLLVVQFMVFKGIFTIRMFAGKFHYQAIVQVPFRIWTFLYQYRLFFFQSCIQSYSGLFFSTFSYGTVHTYFDINKLSIPTYTTLTIDSSYINTNEDIQYTSIENDSDLSTVTIFFGAVLQVPLNVWIVLVQRCFLTFFSYILISTNVYSTICIFIDIKMISISTYISSSVYLSSYIIQYINIGNDTSGTSTNQNLFLLLLLIPLPTMLLHANWKAMYF